MTVCDLCLTHLTPIDGTDRHGADRHGAAICKHDPSYPPALAQLPGAPAILRTTCRDRRPGELLTTPKVALVGEPFYSDYAHRVAYRLAGELAEANVTVTALLCQGIDSIALDGALRAGGPTLAIEPDLRGRGRPGLDRLRARIVETGAVVWGLFPGCQAPRRAGLIEARYLQAAIADAVVVVEARKRSIALFAAELAADLGHDVAVIPGRITDAGGHGAFELLRDGAHPVRDADDVLELIGEFSGADSHS
jgi:DNA processing protein